MPASSSFDRAIQVIVTTAAVAMAAVVIYREIKPAPPPPQWSGAREPQYFENWRALLTRARETGDLAAKLRLVEFIDLECSACRLFHQTTLPQLREEFGPDLAVSFVHLPLEGHRFADQAANAAECAALQNQFGPFMELVLKKQDSVGLKQWTSFARDAGVRDLKSFATCIAGARRALVDSGRAIANRLGINSTPTLIANGWKVPSPTVTELRRVLTALRDGHEPFPNATRVSLLAKSP